MNVLDWVALVLIILCGLDVGLSGLFNVNLLSTLLGPASLISFGLYALFSIASVYMIYTALKKTQNK
ncbi:MAG: DUF378 domain-containing protein [Gammaproteobacteria bacterium]|nr:DUF378 domain-containing protein [Gammaproteobacteria bacterium]